MSKQLLWCRKKQAAQRQHKFKCGDIVRIRHVLSKSNYPPTIRWDDISTEDRGIITQRSATGRYVVNWRDAGKAAWFDDYELEFVE